MTVTMMTMIMHTADRAHLRPRHEEITHLCEANANRRNQTELSLLKHDDMLVTYMMIFMMIC